jgi:hypothetical protein
MHIWGLSPTWKPFFHVNLMVDQYRIVSLVFGVVIQPCVGKGRTTSRCPWAPRTTDGIRGCPTLKNKVLLPVFFSHIYRWQRGILRRVSSSHPRPRGENFSPSPRKLAGDIVSPSPNPSGECIPDGVSVPGISLERMTHNIEEEMFHKRSLHQLEIRSFSFTNHSYFAAKIANSDKISQIRVRMRKRRHGKIHLCSPLAG